MPTLLDDALLADTLKSLPGWNGDPHAIWREVHLTPELDTELRRQIAVDGGSMNHPPAIEDLGHGVTRFVLRTEETDGVSELDITLASHISDLAHRLDENEPGVNAVRPGHSVAIVRHRDGEPD